jgi:hypothetical protein
LIVKCNSSLLTIFRREFDLFESPSLDKAFIRAFSVERKVAPQIRSPPTQYGPSAASPWHTQHSMVSPISPSTPRNVPWCTFHKTNLHESTNCQSLKKIHTNQNLFVEVAHLDSSDHPEVVCLDNPIEVDPSLILMTTNELNVSYITLFTHNC